MDPTRDPSRIISYEEGAKMAKLHKMKYCETSALTQTGLSDCFREAINQVVNAPRSSKKKGGFLGLFSKKKKALPEPPVMPPTGEAPDIVVETSTFMEEWQKTLENPQHTDVVFVVESKHRFKAHKLVLCSAAEFFCKVLGIIATEENQLKQIETSYTRDEINQGDIPGLTRVHDERTDDKSATQTVLEMSSDVKSQYFVHLLEFIYTGVPKLTADTSEEDLDNLINLSRIFKLPQLETICVNIKNEEDCLNPSIGAHFIDQVGPRMKELFLNKTRLADVMFKVGGQEIYAHKCVLTTRSEVMAAMLGGSFKEGSSSITEIDILDTTAESFLAFLEYLYTDHAPIEDGDSVGIMVLADQYCQSRLINLCELCIKKEVDQISSEDIQKSDIDVIGLLLTSQYLNMGRMGLHFTNEVDRAITNNIHKSDIDVIGLLMMPQLHNATQLSKWCLFFISSNYMAFKERKEFPLLVGENLEYVIENQWPPISYMKDVEKFEKEMAKHNEKCSIM